MRITVQGEVTRSCYHPGSCQMQEYCIKITVANISDADFVFDEVHGIFAPPAGKTLDLVILHTEKPKTGEESGKPVKSAIAPGQTMEFEFRSNGYTNDLLAQAGRNAMMLIVSFVNRKLPTMDRFVAVLPHLAQCPEVPTLSAAPKQAPRGQTLKFKYQSQVSRN